MIIKIDKSNEIITGLTICDNAYGVGAEDVIVLPPNVNITIDLSQKGFDNKGLEKYINYIAKRVDRFEKCVELGAPDIIVSNEKRMLKESVQKLLNVR